MLDEELEEELDEDELVPTLDCELNVVLKLDEELDVPILDWELNVVLELDDELDVPILDCELGLDSELELFSNSVEEELDELTLL